MRYEEREVEVLEDGEWRVLKVQHFEVWESGVLQVTTGRDLRWYATGAWRLARQVGHDD